MNHTVKGVDRSGYIMRLLYTKCIEPREPRKMIITSGNLSFLNFTNCKNGFKPHLGQPINGPLPHNVTAKISISGKKMYRKNLYWTL